MGAGRVGVLARLILLIFERSWRWGQVSDDWGKANIAFKKRQDRCHPGGPERLEERADGNLTKLNEDNCQVLHLGMMSIGL